jgi:hypothetical protein
MTDRLSLTNALADANIDRQNAERIATIIVRAIRNSAGAAPDFDQREPLSRVPLRAPHRRAASPAHCRPSLAHGIERVIGNLRGIGWNVSSVRRLATGRAYNGREPTRLFYDKVRDDEGAAIAASLGSTNQSGKEALSVLMIGRCKPDEQSPSEPTFMGVSARLIDDAAAGPCSRVATTHMPAAARSRRSRPPAAERIRSSSSLHPPAR